MNIACRRRVMAATMLMVWLSCRSLCGIGLALSYNCCEVDSHHQVAQHSESSHSHKDHDHHHDHESQNQTSEDNERSSDKGGGEPIDSQEFCCDDFTFTKTKSPIGDDWFPRCLVYHQGFLAADAICSSLSNSVVPGSEIFADPVSAGELCLLIVGEIHFPHGPPVL